jgi:DNA-binding XRE family transcriptional regulator
MSNRSNQLERTEAAGIPMPEQIRVARVAAGLTQEQAAALIGRSARWWRAIETISAEHSRTMDPALWELWQLLAREDDVVARAGFMQMRRAARRNAKIGARMRSAESR